MISIKTPEKYISEINVLEHSGKYIEKIGKYALIIGGKTALKSAGEKLTKSLSDKNVKYKIEEFIGYCTYENIDKYVIEVKKIGVDVVIGIGGGRSLDLVKAVGERSNLPVVTVPTIAATCAAWSALSVIYDDEGRHTDYFLLENSPKLILADTRIIYEAPKRYLNAGIGDTLVKWYEAAPHKTALKDITIRIGLQTSELALDILKNYINRIEKSEYIALDEKFQEVVDAIIVLAGLVGSVKGGNHAAAIGHTLHDSLTHVLDTKGTLHGEKVIFGLIVQFILEGKSDEEVEKLVYILNLLNLPVSLEQLGIKENINNKITNISNEINFTVDEVNDLTFSVDKNLIEKAIVKADAIGRKRLAV